MSMSSPTCAKTLLSILVSSIMLVFASYIIVLSASSNGILIVLHSIVGLLYLPLILCIISAYLFYDYCRVQVVPDGCRQVPLGASEAQCRQRRRDLPCHRQGTHFVRKEAFTVKCLAWCKGLMMIAYRVMSCSCGCDASA